MLEIAGGNHPTPPSKALMAQIAHIVQFSLIGVAVGGDYILTNIFNYPTQGPFPPVYQAIREKKMFVGMGAWFLGNSIAQSLSSTGAFEVAFNGHLIFSKLASHSGELPSLSHITTELLRLDPKLDTHRIHSSGHSHTARGHAQVPGGKKRLVQDEIEDGNVDDMAFDSE